MTQEVKTSEAQEITKPNLAKLNPPSLKDRTQDQADAERAMIDRMLPKMKNHSDFHETSRSSPPSFDTPLDLAPVLNRLKDRLNAGANIIPLDQARTGNTQRLGGEGAGTGGLTRMPMTTDGRREISADLERSAPSRQGSTPVTLWSESSVREANSLLIHAWLLTKHSQEESGTKDEVFKAWMMQIVNYPPDLVLKHLRWIPETWSFFPSWKEFADNGLAEDTRRRMK